MDTPPGPPARFPPSPFSKRPRLCAKCGAQLELEPTSGEYFCAECDITLPRNKPRGGEDHA